MPQNTLRCPENPFYNCLEVLCHMNTPTNNSSQLPKILHPQLFECFTKIFEILFDLPKILSSLLLLKFLLACIMVKSHKYSNLIGILCHYHLSLLIQYVADARNPQSDHRIHPSVLDVIWPRVVSRPIKLPLIVSLRLFNLLIFWSERLLLIFYFWIMISLHLSIELFRCFYNSKPLHSFFFWLSTDTHIRSYVDNQILCWILSNNVLHIQ